MARYDVSSNGAESLMKLSRSLLSSYGDVICAGVALDDKIDKLDNKDEELYEQIIDTSKEITSRLKSEKETFVLLAKNLMSLSVRVREIIGETKAVDSSNINSEIGVSFCESDEEREVVNSFNSGLFDLKTMILVDPPGGQYQSWVNANDIMGVFHNDDVNANEFWTHHNESKERFYELASNISAVKALVDQGVDLEQIKKEPELAPCVEQYFSPNRVIKVYKYGDRYVFAGDGRHRIRIAQEMGINIPILVSKVVQKV